MRANEVEQLVSKELEASKNKRGYFASDYEAAAMLMKEIQEVRQHYKKIKELFEALWTFIVNDNYSAVFLNKIRNRAIAMAIKSIKIAALAQKFIDSKEQCQED